jgi:hypothetical protein
LSYEDHDERPSKKRQVEPQYRVVDIIDDKSSSNLDPEEINKIVESAADIQVPEFNFFICHVELLPINSTQLTNQGRRIGFCWNEATRGFV